MSTLIALHGRLQAGKDTTFERIALLASILPFDQPVSGTTYRRQPVGKVERLAFADPLKDSAAALLDVTREELEYMKVAPEVSVSVRVPLSGDPNDVRYRTFGMTGREYLQRYGTESHRGVFGDSFWVDQAMSKVNTDPRAVTVITDCRFPNECDAVHEYGGYVVHVVGPDGKAEGGHASEQVLDDALIDFEIDNSVRGDNYAHLDAEIKRALPFLDPHRDTAAV